MVHINSLPDELLIHIFKMMNPMIWDVEECNTIGWEGMNFPVIPSPLVCLTHVCHRWRELAIDCSTLWTRVSNRKPGQLEEFVRRSKHLPMSFYLQIQRPEDAMQTVIDHGPRIRRLDIRTNMVQLDISPLLSFDPTALECVTFSCDVDEGIEYALDDIRVSQPQILNGHSTSLCALGLSPVTVWLPSNHFPSLTYLFLSFDTFVAEVSVSHFLNFLRNTPALEFLHLAAIDDLCKFGYDPAVDIDDHVRLEHLRSCVVVESQIENAFELLRELELPPTARIRLMEIESSGSDAPPPLPSMAVLDTVTRLEIAADDWFIHLIAEGPVGGFWLEADIYEAVGINSWGTWLYGLHEMVPLAQVTSLNLYIARQGPCIPNILKTMTALTYLGVRLDGDVSSAVPSSRPGPLSRVAHWLFDTLGRPNLHNCPMLETLAVDLFQSPNDEYPSSDDNGGDEDSSEDADRDDTKRKGDDYGSHDTKRAEGGEWEGKRKGKDVDEGEGEDEDGVEDEDDDDDDDDDNDDDNDDEDEDESEDDEVAFRRVWRKLKAMDGIEDSSDEDECDCAGCALARRTGGSEAGNVGRRMVPPGLIHALALRARSGRSVQRLVFKPWAKDTTMRRVGPQRLNSYVRDLEVTIGKYVGKIHVPQSNIPAVQFTMRDSWRIEGAEKYWTIPDDERPSYRLPWENGD